MSSRTSSISSLYCYTTPHNTTQHNTTKQSNKPIQFHNLLQPHQLDHCKSKPKNKQTNIPMPATTQTKPMVNSTMTAPRCSQDHIEKSTSQQNGHGIDSPPTKLFAAMEADNSRAACTEQSGRADGVDECQGSLRGGGRGVYGNSWVCIMM